MCVALSQSLRRAVSYDRLAAPMGIVHKTAAVLIFSFSSACIAQGPASTAQAVGPLPELNAVGSAPEPSTETIRNVASSSLPDVVLRNRQLMQLPIRNAERNGGQDVAPILDGGAASKVSMTAPSQFVQPAQPEVMWTQHREQSNESAPEWMWIVSAAFGAFLVLLGGIVFGRWRYPGVSPVPQSPAQAARGRPESAESSMLERAVESHERVDGQPQEVRLPEPVVEQVVATLGSKPGGVPGEVHSSWGEGRADVEPLYHEVRADAPAQAVVGFGATTFGTIGLDFGEGAMKLAELAVEPLTPEDLANIARNKLELAAEYAELGDVVHARVLLQEIIASNNAGTLEEARTELRKLGPGFGHDGEAV